MISLYHQLIRKNDDAIQFDFIYPIVELTLHPTFNCLNFNPLVSIYLIFT